MNRLGIADCGFRISECYDTMGERIGRIERINTDFLIFYGFQACLQKKRVNRSPTVS
jgi:hypothetical protein